MRLFVAAEIGDRLAARAMELIGELQRRATTTAPRAKVTWLTLERLHITIRFIGEVDDARGAAICHALESPPAVAPFDLTLAGPGVFPKSGPPRLLWIGVERGKDRLMDVEREVSARLTTCGLPPDARRFDPHLTLARVRDAAGLRAASLFSGLKPGLGTARIDTITLFRSDLSSHGPRYTPLARIALMPDQR